MSETKSKSGCWRTGCMGCLALIALGIVLFLTLAAIQVRNENREPVFERVDNLQQLPGEPYVFDALISPEALEAGAATDAPELPGSIELPQTPSPEALAEAGVASGRVMVDLSAGEFRIRPGEPGESLRVEADFDGASFELEEELVAEDDGTWSYRVRFGARGGWLGMLRGKEVNNNVTLVLPRGRPITLVGEVGLGESEIDLGGLWLEHLDLDLGAGEHLVEFSEPTLAPVPEMRIEGSAGELKLRQVGNASPATLRVEQSFGASRIDLGGAWRQDADVDVRFGFGECRIRQGDTARLTIESARVSAGERRISLADEDSLPEDAPLLTLEVSGTAGELRID